MLDEGVIGLVLTSLMILIFLGSMRATFAVLLSIPISALATFVVLYLLGSTVNTMILGGLALAFSRVIDNSVISLENIYRHLEMGSSPAVAAEQGGAEVSLAVLAATLVDVVDFFPVTLLLRRQQVPVFRAGAGVLSVAAGVVRGRHDGDPAVLLAIPEGDVHHGHATAPPEYTAILERALQRLVQSRFQSGCSIFMSAGCGARCGVPRSQLAAARWASSSPAWRSIPFLGLAFFPQTDAGQFTINIKVPTGTPH